MGRVVPAFGGAVAQWSEQGTHNPSVEGSIPSGPTLFMEVGASRMETDMWGRERSRCTPPSRPDRRRRGLETPSTGAFPGEWANDEILVWLDSAEGRIRDSELRGRIRNLTRTNLGFLRVRVEFIELDRKEQAFLNSLTEERPGHDLGTVTVTPAVAVAVTVAVPSRLRGDRLGRSGGSVTGVVARGRRRGGRRHVDRAQRLAAWRVRRFASRGAVLCGS
jgi:hypothetical protein